MTKIAVTKLSFNTTEESIHALFSTCGKVESVDLQIDRMTGLSRGFAYVTMSSGADVAMSTLNGTMLDGHTIAVNEAMLRQESRGGGGGGGGRRRR